MKYTVLVERYTGEYPEHVFVGVSAECAADAENMALDYAADRTDWAKSPGEMRNGMMVLRTIEEKD